MEKGNDLTLESSKTNKREDNTSVMIEHHVPCLSCNPTKLNDAQPTSVQYRTLVPVYKFLVCARRMNKNEFAAMDPVTPLGEEFTNLLCNQEDRYGWIR